MSMKNNKSFSIGARGKSFKYAFDGVIAFFKAEHNAVLHLAGTAAVTSYINAVLAQYDAATPAKQLEIIMTQKWISNYGNAVDQYTDYRRTGYPVLFDPNDAAMAPNHQVQPPPNGDPANPGNRKVPVQLLRPFAQTLPWNQTELENNANAPKQKDPATFKPFWKP